MDSHKSPTTMRTFSCCNIISHQWWSNLIWFWFMNEVFFMIIHCLKFHQIIQDINTSTHQQVLAKKNILSSWLIACCNLTPTLARQMWRHKYVIGRNEYLISTVLESTVPCIYSQQFLFKSTHHSWKYERNCKWVFFSEHSVFIHTITIIITRLLLLWGSTVGYHSDSLSSCVFWCRMQLWILACIYIYKNAVRNALCR